VKITRNGSQPSIKGLADWFTGMVRIDAMERNKEAENWNIRVVYFSHTGNTRHMAEWYKRR